MHHVNAYDLYDTTLVIDVVSYLDSSLTTFYETDIFFEQDKTW